MRVGHGNVEVDRDKVLMELLTVYIITQGNRPFSASMHFIFHKAGVKRQVQIPYLAGA